MGVEFRESKAAPRWSEKNDSTMAMFGVLGLLVMPLGAFVIGIVLLPRRAGTGVFLMVASVLLVWLFVASLR